MQGKLMNKGFTLIELIAVIAIITGLTVALLVNGTKGRDDTQVDAAARQLESMFAYAQTMGKGGKAREGDTSLERFDKGFGIYLEKDSNEVILYGGDGIDPTDLDNNTYDSSNMVSQSVFGGGVTVTNICAHETAGGPCSGAGFSNELHVLYRRGNPINPIHTDHPNKVFVDAQITLGVHGITRTVVVNDAGMIYTQ